MFCESFNALKIIFHFPEGIIFLFPVFLTKSMKKKPAKIPIYIMFVLSYAYVYIYVYVCVYVCKLYL